MVDPVGLDAVSNLCRWIAGFADDIRADTAVSKLRRTRFNDLVSPGDVIGVARIIIHSIEVLLELLATVDVNQDHVGVESTRHLGGV